MRRLFLVLCLICVPPAVISAEGRSGSIHVTLKGGSEEAGSQAAFQVFKDKACRHPVQKDGSDLILYTDSKGNLPDPGQDGLYLRQSAGPPGYYLSPEVIPVKEAYSSGITLSLDEILYCISTKEPYPDRFIYDEEGTLQEGLLLPGKTYLVSAYSRDEWICCPAVGMKIPLYDEGMVEITLTEQSFGRIVMKGTTGEYAVYEDAECTKPMNDIYGLPAAVSAEKGADVFPGTCYLKQKSEGDGFFPDEKVYTVSAEEKNETLFEPEQQALQLRVNVVDQLNQPADLTVTCTLTGSDGESLTYPIEKGEGIIPVPRPDTYQVALTELPAGYCSKAPAEFIADKESAAKENALTLSLQSFDLKIAVLQEQTKQPAEGTKLRLTDRAGNICAEWMSTKDAAGDVPALNGKKVQFYPGDVLKLTCIGDADHFVTQKETEIVIPEQIDGDTVSFAVGAKRYVTADLRMKDEQGNLTEGASAVFYTDPECTQEAFTVWNEPAELHTSETVDLFPGTYYVRQKDVPEGCYRSDETTEVHLNESGGVTLQCRHVSVLFRLTDASHSESLEGGTLLILDEDGNECGVIDCHNGEGRNDFLLQPDREYRVRVTEAPAFHIPPEESVFRTGTYEDTEEVIEMGSYLTLQVVLKMPDGTNGEGGSYALYTDSSCQNRAADIQGNPVGGSGGLQADLFPGTYYLKEETAPDGCYPQSEPEELVMPSSGSVTYEKQCEPASVMIRCLDAADEHPLTDTTLQIVTEEGEVLQEFTPPEEGMTVLCSKDGLQPGMTYYLKTAVSSHMHIPKENEIPFQIPAEIPESSAEIIVYEIPYTAVLLQKRSGSDPLAGFPAEVCADSACSVNASDVRGMTASGSTDGNGEILWYLTEGEYWLKEGETSSHWYPKKEPVRFTVSPASEPSVRIISETQEAAFCISVCDEEGNHLSGARIEVFDSDHELVTEITSTEEPYMIDDDSLLPAGTYTIHQVSAADGYQANGTDIEFVMPDTAPSQIPVLMIRNERLRETKSGRRPAGKDPVSYLFLLPVIAAGTGAVFLLLRRRRA